MSDIAKTFDVLGWFSPTIKVKFLLQQLWEQKVDWDETVELHTDFVMCLCRGYLPQNDRFPWQPTDFFGDFEDEGCPSQETDNSTT